MEKSVITMILKNGTTTGIIQLDLDEWKGVSYKIPRNKLKEAKDLEYINNTGVYILLGVDEDTGENRAYIGETEGIYQRLLEHNRDKDFWNECIVFMSNNNFLNKGHVKFIEKKLYQKGQNVNRYLVENANTPCNTSLEEADEINAMKFFYKIILLTSIYGYHIFDEIVTEKDENNSKILYLKNNGIEYGKGIVTDEGFVILKGSKIIPEIAKSLSPSLLKFAERERTCKDIKDGVFISDHICSTPSMAAVIILGRNSNGYNEWKNKDGKKLRELY